MGRAARHVLHTVWEACKTERRGPERERERYGERGRERVMGAGCLAAGGCCCYCSWCCCCCTGR